eukprot:GHVQ01013152.1.p1 GENE.GHVQ01013152.1~~GHVQ01013152.1.p1  ORF type:complete len:373 (+),score=46.04 GHVQ01013152.1:244-1362(+)
MAIVHRWNDFDLLEEVVLGIADRACFPPCEPACQSEFNNDEFSRWLPWPSGPKLQDWIDKCNLQLNGLREALEGEGVTVRRPEVIEYNTKVVTPDFEISNQYCSVCPRDVMMTVGSEVIEAPMSKRHRYFEFRPYRKLVKDYFDRDPACQWVAAPKPLMADESYNPDFWNWTIEQRKERMHKYEYVTTEEEVFFDAADTMLLGQDMFVQQSMTTNLRGFKWLQKHFKASQNIDCHLLHFPYDLFPSHIDCTFVAVRPGLCLTNPERPPVHEEVKIFTDNEWELRDVPYPSTDQMPVFCQSSKWLAMNVLSVSQNKIVVEEQEVALAKFLEDLGFDVISVPFRNVFEFGGSLHCSTWDVRRRGERKNYFPNRT